MKKRIEIKFGIDFGKLFIGAIIFFACFFLTAYYATSILTIKSTNAATDVAVVVNGSGYYINASTASQGTIQLNVDSTPSGSIALAKDTLNVKSNAPEGYKVYVAMARDENCASDCNSLYKDKGSASESSISATSGTFSTPAVLGSNSWGWAIDKNAVGAPENNFSTDYNTAVPDPTVLWAAMPEKGQDQLLQTITTPNSEEGIATDIYYGVKANTALASGIYEGTIVYTVVGNAGVVPEVADVSPSTTELLTGGETITINTLYNITPAQAGTVNVTIGGEPCTGVNLSQDVDNNLTITCTSPAHDAGKYNVVVSILSYSKEATLVNALEYIVDTATPLSLQTAASWAAPSVGATTSSLTYPAGYYSAGTYNVDLGGATAANVLSGVTFSSNTAGINQTGTMPNYQAQYDTTKTAAQNTADAGLTWSDGTLSIAEGYHVAQTVAGQGGIKGCGTELAMIMSYGTGGGYARIVKNNGASMLGSDNVTGDYVRVSYNSSSRVYTMSALKSMEYEVYNMYSSTHSKQTYSANQTIVTLNINTSSTQYRAYIVCPMGA